MAMTPATLLRPGQTCWRLARAEKAAVIIDAATYFSAAKAAILAARHTVFLIGWDFDLRIRLEPKDPNPPVPDTLGDFLQHVVEIRPELRIFVLRWDLSFIKFPFRTTVPLKLLDWVSGKRLDYHLDHEHPPGSCHHQKIVVIDDAVAFCGGIDMTIHRWDTSEHLDDDPFRVDPTGQPYPPWHDATMCVSGDAARALGDLARERWRRATREIVQPVRSMDGCWPATLEPNFEDVEIAIARTEPPYGDAQPEIREIETLYLAAIQAAKQVIYIETQYFASHHVVSALAERLKEPEGPEIVLVNPRSAVGWLEEEVMGASRAVLLDTVHAADRYGRFRIFTPVTEQGQDIYVHAKILIIDDRLLRVGSSNLNNRSMGVDTECDVAIEADQSTPDGEAKARVIAALRDRLVSEHLGTTPEKLSATRAQCHGSLVAALDKLRLDSRRTLVPFVPPAISETHVEIARSQLMDPDHVEPLAITLSRGAQLPSLRNWILAGAAALAAAGAAAAGLARRKRSAE